MKSDLNALLFGGCTYVPIDIAVCPECGAQLHAESTGWGAVNGEPNIGALMIDCVDDPECEHRHWQCDWQPVINAVEKWCGASDV